MTIFRCSVVWLAASLAIPASAGCQTTASQQGEKFGSTTAGQQPVVPIPPAQTIVNMARNVAFESLGVTDEPVPSEIRQLNPNFAIQVYFRSGPEAVAYPPEGAIFARVSVRGVPKERTLPDGEYYLWIGGDIDSLRGALARLDGQVLKEVEIDSQPALAEESIPHGPKVHILVEAAVTASGAVPLPTVGPTPPKPPPPKPPPPKPPPPKPSPPPEPRRSWRQICVRPAPSTDHGGEKKWVRVPDN